MKGLIGRSAIVSLNPVTTQVLVRLNIFEAQGPLSGNFGQDFRMRGGDSDAYILPKLSSDLEV